MAGRRTFFSFHYQRDVWRTAVVRNANVVSARAAAGWEDASIWEDAKRKGKKSIQKLIDRGLQGTSVTVVLIGAETHKRTYVKYEIEKSLERGNGLLGIFIHDIPDQKQSTDRKGAVPDLLAANKVPCYEWNRKKFGAWVERAAIHAGHPCLKHKEKDCLVCRTWLWLKVN